MYRNYIFDLYGTLADIHTNEQKPYLWKKMAEIYSAQGACYTPLELRRTYAQLCSDYKALNPDPFHEINLLPVFSELFCRKGITVPEGVAYSTAVTFRTLSRNYLRLYPGVLPLLDTLVQKEKHIFLLSNAQACFTLPEIQMLGIKDYFEDILISSDIGICKPGTAFMNCLLERNGLSIFDSVMIGNEIECDIQIANDCGMDSLYIHSNISSASDLNRTSLATHNILDGNVCRIPGFIL